MEENFKRDKSKLQSENHRALDQRDEYKDKMEATQEEYYDLLVSIIQNCHCSIPYIEGIKRDSMIKHIKDCYRVGQELGHTKEAIMGRIECGLMEFYMRYNMQSEAFEALDCMPRTNNYWVNIRPDIVKWSVTNGKVWTLLAHLQKRLDDWSTPYDKRDEFRDYIKKVKDIAGY